MSSREYPPNMVAADGFRYAVRFGDGSLAEQWNGPTQLERAQAFAAEARRQYAPDRFVVVRRRTPSDPWETYHG